MSRQFTPVQIKDLKKDFLDAFLETGQKKAAAKIIGIGERTVHYWIRWDSAFAKQVKKTHAKFIMAN